MSRKSDWPDWWGYEIAISSHVVKRMGDRGFTELDLRAMLEDATQWRQAAVPGRVIIQTSHDQRRWEVVVEPDEWRKSLVVVTAYRVE